MFLFALSFAYHDAEAGFIRFCGCLLFLSHLLNKDLSRGSNRMENLSNLLGTIYV